MAKQPKKSSNNRVPREIPAEITPVDDSSQVFDPKILDKLPEKERKIVWAMLSYRHSGPLPAVDTLRGYAELIPDGANRVMVMAEEQAAHRMSIEKTVINGQVNQSGRGQTFGLIIGLTALMVGMVCALTGHELAGSIIGGGGITGLVAVFVIGSKGDSKNRGQKNPRG